MSLHHEKRDHPMLCYGGGSRINIQSRGRGHHHRHRRPTPRVPPDQQPLSVDDSSRLRLNWRHGPTTWAGTSVLAYTACGCLS